MRSPEWPNPGKLLCFRVILNKGLEPFGPVSQDPEGFLFKDCGAQKSCCEGFKGFGALEGRRFGLLGLPGPPKGPQSGKVFFV